MRQLVRNPLASMQITLGGMATFQKIIRLSCALSPFCDVFEIISQPNTPEIEHTMIPLYHV